MPGTLYVVATPIGNLADMSPRVAATLCSVGFIAAEDTRVTQKLLYHLGVKKPLISYNQHNAKARGALILARIAAGEDCALCSDAGTPAISDPGELLVKDALAQGLCVVPVPGASAAIAALSASGLPCGRFVFEGFITQNKRQRAQRLAQLAMESRTIIIYEAPHKLAQTLAAMCEAFGGERPLTLCRELTKLYEEIWPTTLEEAAQRYQSQSPKGEFVLVVAGAPQAVEDGYTLKQAAEMARRLAQEGALPHSQAARMAAAETGLAKSAIYRQMIDEGNSET